MATAGFQEAVILTDHGFFLNTALEAGDVCNKPSGDWVNLHERMLIGSGSADSHNLVMEKGVLGIRGDFDQVATPRALVTYRAGISYFHGGISLQEALVPVISMRIKAAEKKTDHLFTVTLHYRRGNTSITTRLPVVEVTVAGQSSMFATEGTIDLLIEAHDLKGQVVGEAKLGGIVNASTRTISLKAGETVPVTLKMDQDYEGKFTVKAIDPITSRELGKSLDLETNYIV